MKTPFNYLNLIPDFSKIRKQTIGHRYDFFSKILDNIPEVSKLIILTDIVNFSMRDSKKQVQDIFIFQHFLKSKSFQNRLSFKKNIKIENFIPTGDGCYIIADEENPEKALEFLVNMISEMKDFSKTLDEPIHIRVSALIGKCYPFRDVANNLNYIGDGMNEAARILSGGQKSLEEDFIKKQDSNEDSKSLLQKANIYSQDSLFLGDSLSSHIEKFSEQIERSILFKNVTDKHGLCRNVTALVGIK